MKEGWGTLLRRGGMDLGPFGVVCCSPHLVDAEGWMGLLLLEVTSCFAPSPAVPAVDAGASPSQCPCPARLLDHRRPPHAAGSPEAPGCITG